MSLKAMLWVMERAPVNTHTELAVLYALADRADDTGDSAYPSQDWIADRARCSVRTVRRTLGNLERAGIITHGDQRHVAHIRADRRPTVWQLNLTLDRHHTPPTTTPEPGAPGCEESAVGEATGGHRVRPSGGVDHSTTGQSVRADTGSRPDTGGRTTGHPGSHDRTPVVVRPDTAVSDEPSLTILNPPGTVPPLSPQGDVDESDVVDAALVDADTTPSQTVLAVPETTGTPGKKTTPAKSSPTARGTRLPEDYRPSPAAVARIRERYPSMENWYFRLEFEKFTNYWLAKTGAGATKRDWDRTWMNWMLNAVDRLPARERDAMRAGSPEGQVPVQVSKQQQAHDIAAELAAEFAPTTQAGGRA